jgi:ABC-type dipeptide/oligopeptide/nickel transport system permease subunit
MLITLMIGIPVGAIAGYFGGRIDNILMRITDAALALPSLLVLILLSAILREVDAPFLKNNPVLTIAGVIGLLAWMFNARLVRASYLAIREMDFVSHTRQVDQITPDSGTHFSQRYRTCDRRSHRSCR